MAVNVGGRYPIDEIHVKKGTIMVSLVSMYKTVNTILTWAFPLSCARDL